MTIVGRKVAHPPKSLDQAVRPAGLIDNGAPTAVMIVFAFWCAGPTLILYAKLCRGALAASALGPLTSRL